MTLASQQWWGSHDETLKWTYLPREKLRKDFQKFIFPRVLPHWKQQTLRSRTMAWRIFFLIQLYCLTFHFDNCHHSFLGFPNQCVLRALIGFDSISGRGYARPTSTRTTSTRRRPSLRGMRRAGRAGAGAGEAACSTTAACSRSGPGAAPLRPPPPPPATSASSSSPPSSHPLRPPTPGDTSSAEPNHLKHFLMQKSLQICPHKVGHIYFSPLV